MSGWDLNMGMLSSCQWNSNIYQGGFDILPLMPQPFLPFVPSSHVSNQHQDFFSSFFLFLIYFNWRLIALRYCGDFCHTFTSISHGRTCVPHPNPRPFPSHPSGSSQYSSPEHPVSCMEPGLAISFTYDNIHVSMLFSQIIPPPPSPIKSKRLFYTSVFLLLSCRWQKVKRD